MRLPRPNHDRMGALHCVTVPALSLVIAAVSSTAITARSASAQDLTISIRVDGGAPLVFDPPGTPVDGGDFNFQGEFNEVGIALFWDITSTAGSEEFCDAPALLVALRIGGSGSGSHQFEIIVSQPVFAFPATSSALRSSIGGGVTAVTNGVAVRSVGGAPMVQALVDNGPIFEAYAGLSIAVDPFDSAVITPEQWGGPIADQPAPQSAIAFRFLVELTDGAAPTFTGVMVAQRPRFPDINGDGVVDGADLGIMLSQWGQCGPADLNYDGAVGGADLGILLASWTG